ncbi:MAG TPA: hypothetical protein VN345_18890 [Blastocatellia bacterium]|nr:hypothetical protein [Blastocatellia bacterium]
MKYFYLEPEVAGGFGEGSVLDTSVHPPRVARLHYEFYGWLGGDLLTSFPSYIVTDRLKDKLQKSDATGYELDRVEVTKSEFFKDMYPKAPPLPRFHWLKITGQAGLDDFGMATNHRLVVSERILRLLQSLNLSDSDIREFP